MRNYKIEKDFVYRGFRCIIIGQALGHRCGYVAIPKGHLWHGVDWTSVDYESDLYVKVHGGLTYSESSYYTDYPVESDCWWIGFDCCHWNDAKDFELIKELSEEFVYKHLLKMETLFPTGGEVKTVEYVEEEIKCMVEQLEVMK